ncbi:MAG: dethiobiotin synthase [Myxococcota bacterium]
MVVGSLMHDLEAALQERQVQGLMRDLAFPQGIDFTSNDYLGLSRHEEVARAAHQAIERWGVGAPASRLLRGHLPVHDAAEQAAAAWVGSEAALLFPSGWQANLALLSGLTQVEDVLFSDSLNHASLIDGCRLSRARVEIFAHADLAQLELLLKRYTHARRRVVVVEAVYSMDGDIYPLAALHDLAERYDAWILLDEAHSAGVLGPEGAGLGATLTNQRRILTRTVTGGKALGVAGAFVCANQTVVRTLVNGGRSFIYTTATPPAIAAALCAAIHIVRSEPERRERVLRHAALLRNYLKQHDLHVLGETPIVPVILGSAPRSLHIAKELEQCGFEVRAIRPPTVPVASSRLRVVVHAQHTPEQIERLGEAIVGAVKKYPSTLPRSSNTQRMPQGLVVVGTDTGVGKTVVAAMCVRDLIRRGIDGRYLKPIQTGCESDTVTVTTLSGMDPIAVVPPALHLEHPASVDQAARVHGVDVRVSHIVDKTRAQMLRQSKCRWVIESLGGLLVPYNTTEDQSHFLQQIQLPVVLVARSGLGTLNHTFLTLEALRQRKLRVTGLVLVGPAHLENVRTLEARLGGLPVLVVPSFDRVEQSSIDRWLDDADLERLWS